MQQQAWSGPLPPPAVLGQFDSVVDNGAERIFRSWESETAHRQSMAQRELTLYWLTIFSAKYSHSHSHSCSFC
ncbi:DUF2335 domain-containing protein [Planktotalea sp.]|uniref:DUF2335 domain-containing protein n=1 Tax=Planktotalea sp. TaxID=2029877 RepID=UPI00344B6B56